MINNHSSLHFERKYIFFFQILICKIVGLQAQTILLINLTTQITILT